MKSDFSQPLAGSRPLVDLTPLASGQKNSPPSNYRSILAKVHDLATLGRELVIRGFSKRTIKEYLSINRRFLAFIGKSAKETNVQDIKNYLL